MNRLVTLAMAGKIARLDGGVLPGAGKGRSAAGNDWQALERMGRDTPPVEGDNIPPGVAGS